MSDPGYGLQSSAHCDCSCGEIYFGDRFDDYDFGDADFCYGFSPYFDTQ